MYHTILLIALAAGGLVLFGAGAAELRVEIVPQWAGETLTFDAAPAAGRPSINRLDFLVSEVALRDAAGIWSEAREFFAVIKARDGQLVWTLPAVGEARYTAVRFAVGLAPALNARDPASFAPTHPLHPAVNGLHWGGTSGYVFLALEGHWRPAEGATRGFSYHLAGPELPMQVELALPAVAGVAQVALDVATLFRGVSLVEATQSTHSRAGDPLAALLRRNVVSAFVSPAGAPARFLPAVARAAPSASPRIIAAGATPYRFSYPAYFPQPALPTDNPLTEPGVELGRALYFDRRLSGAGNQSCATCHRPEHGFIDPQRRFSRGSNGAVGTRNSMPLTNLAWNPTFFWDGRAASLRQQVLQPLENPAEMNARLPTVVGFLRGDAGYRERFAAAFGSAEINADLLARALEQFLLTLVAGDTKLDRTVRDGIVLSEEEQRGFELFQTEYDPRRGLFGADCFHCHGGALFRSQTFANNGLDAVPADWGRALVTGLAADRGKFAVPSLRNVARTAPYMHDGRFHTLEEVVAHYASGVQRSATLDPNLAKHPDGGVPLSAEDQRALVAFLRTLTDDTPPPRPAQPGPRELGPRPFAPPPGELRAARGRFPDRPLGHLPPPPPELTR